MSEIPLEPIAFINEIHELMIKNSMIQKFAITEEAKKSFGASLAKWITVEGGAMTDAQRNQAVRNTMSFIIGYYFGRLHKQSR